jgi:polyhydroxyalkanoate synthase
MVTRRSSGKAQSAAKARSSDQNRSSAEADTSHDKPGTPTGMGFQEVQQAWASVMQPWQALPSWTIDPQALSGLQREYLERAQALMSGPASVDSPADKRFSHSAWRQGPFAVAAAAYLLNAEFMARIAELVDADDKTKDRIRFATEQWVDAASPSNFLATNPEAQQRMLESGGESLRQGMENLIHDLAAGRISQSDETAFDVGQNVASSEGAVVFRNELIEIIQYKPITQKVAKRPLLMVPPCINKFYILDLQPDNSLVQHCLAEGVQVFMLSWRNVDASMGHLTWDDYLETGAIEAIRVVQEISAQDEINLLGFCVGGTIVGATLAALAARKIYPIASLTLLTTLLDFSHPGVLGVFIDEQQVRLREQSLGGGGVMKGKELAATFSALRPNDLVWNYVVNNYLKGERPAAFDLLYWNADSTNLPGPMFAWYLRHMYLQNELCQPHRLICLGESIDLGAIDAPSYIFASRGNQPISVRSTWGVKSDLYSGQVDISRVRLMLPKEIDAAFGLLRRNIYLPSQTHGSTKRMKGKVVGGLIGHNGFRSFVVASVWLRKCWAMPPIRSSTKHLALM